jgi:hypothetical protein
LNQSAQQLTKEEVTAILIRYDKKVQAENEMKFIYYKPPVTEGKKPIAGICIGYVLQPNGGEAHLTVHVMRDKFDRHIGRTACLGRYVKNKVFEVQVLPQAIEESVFLGAQYFLLSRGIK